MRDRMATLKELRETAVLSQEDLAEASGVSRAAISAIENGHRRTRPWPSTIRKLAKALGVKPGDIDFEATERMNRLMARYRR